MIRGVLRETMKHSGDAAVTSGHLRRQLCLAEMRDKLSHALVTASERRARSGPLLLPSRVSHRPVLVLEGLDLPAAHSSVDDVRPRCHMEHKLPDVVPPWNRSLNCLFSRDMREQLRQRWTVPRAARNRAFDLVRNELALRHQIFARRSSARTIPSPGLQPNACANSGMFDSGPLTRNFPGECGSVRI